MKNFISQVIIMGMCINAFAQSPEKMSYQAIIRNTNNALVISHDIGMQISILQGSATGTSVFVETHNTTTNANGLVSIEIGGGTIVSGTFVSIDWSAGSYYIKTETDPTGGTNYTITGTSQILSVPYSFYAKTSESSIDAVKLTGDQTISGNKTFTGITSVIAPVDPSDATNKAYVDELKAQVQALEDNLIATGTYRIIDAGGNQYKVAKIGNKLWMAENLKTTKFSNGENISSGIYFPNNNTSNATTYGLLYTWNLLVDNRNICPTGWHVPSEAEWNNLLSNVSSPAELKESGTTHWLSPNTGATNSVSFTALPAGYFDYVTFGFREVAAFWFSDYFEPSVGRGFKLYYNNSPTTGDYVNALKIAAFSVRCLKDY